MLHQHLEALYYGIFLILQFFHTIGKLQGEIVFHLVAECINQYLYIKFVWCRLTAKVCMFLIRLYIVGSQRYGFFPQFTEFIVTIAYIVIILHCHIQFVTWCRGYAHA